MAMYKSILGMRVDVTSIPDAVSQIDDWTKQGGGRYVCVSNVHMCMESLNDKNFQNVVNGADLVVPDGKPLVWSQKLLGVESAHQVRGMDLMLSLCEHFAQSGVSVGFYGGTPGLLDKLKTVLEDRFASLQIDCLIAPPFRPLTPKENDEYVKKINESGARILFVGIGCPKQEQWMAENRHKLDCIMLGVGAAFDFIAGRKRHAPRWMQAIGLEWFFRFLCEPRRLWRRYLEHNPRFVWYLSKQLFREKFKYDP